MIIFFFLLLFFFLFICSTFISFASFLPFLSFLLSPDFSLKPTSQTPSLASTSNFNCYFVTTMSLFEIGQRVQSSTDQRRGTILTQQPTTTTQQKTSPVGTLNEEVLIRWDKARQDEVVQGNNVLFPFFFSFHCPFSIFFFFLSFLS